MGEMRNSQRHLIEVERHCAMGVITFKNFEWKDHVVQLVDLSRNGIGIESRKSVEHGFVWFKDRVGGHKGGVLVWSGRYGEKYRAGIRFLLLTPGDERFIQKECATPLPHQPLRNPEVIIATLMESLEKTNKSGKIGSFNIAEEDKK